MSVRHSVLTVAVAGAATVGASLIGSAALFHNPGPQTRAVALTAGDTEIFLPDTSSFTPTVAEGFPPLEDVLQGSEVWVPSSEPSGVDIFLVGTDTHTTIGSFVNDDFLESSGDEEGVGSTLLVPSAGSEIDLADFGGGYENEWADIVDANGVHTTTDTFITPFGDYPLSSATVLSEIQTTVTAGEADLTQAAEFFTHGDYVEGANWDFAALNTFVLGVQDDLTIGSYDALTGQSFDAGVVGPFVFVPADYADGLALAQEPLNMAQINLSSALTEFAGNNVMAGLNNLSASFHELAYAPELVTLGLIASLTTS